MCTPAGHRKALCGALLAAAIRFAGGHATPPAWARAEGRFGPTMPSRGLDRIPRAGGDCEFAGRLPR